MLEVFTMTSYCDPILSTNETKIYMLDQVHGPAHPRRSLYVFLQPLIEGLKMLWFKGVLTYYVSLKNNFKMQAVLM